MGSELLPVTQDDRDAAAALWRAVGNAAYSEWQADWMADGTADPGPVVQAFGRHSARSRTITKEQVEEAARELARRNDLTFDTVWEKMSETDRDSFRDDALATASAFGLTVQSS